MIAPIGVSHQKGFTLIELMVALVIGLIIMVGAIQLFLVSKSSFNRVEALAERQEVLRFVSDVISLDVRTASGFDANEADSKIELSYANATYRPDDPYCGGSGWLSGVEYTFSVDSVMVNHACNGNAIVVGDEQPIVGGVEEFNPELLGNGVSIAVEIVFPAIPGESDIARSFSFVVTNRESAMAGL
ncbi:PilW family protein [Halomonas sp. 328]|uniref:PilW family protein n=1 Tax=Halomonas sp. 328 TaxID=2776704 RepID=UPI0018A74AB1|nr:prepilin-type N-terminal cleavage/methylation domain-containing protein [Halomonas sp. 328]MBF8224213.1 prepilin-type N-terminal cleavage/methylation domain-containing protein [Halomonas sp. 328]